MSTPIEMEKKYKVLDPNLDRVLQTMRYVTSKTIIDRYMDTSVGFYYQEGIFIRIRNEKSLDIKFNPDHLGLAKVRDHTVCHEYNIDIPFKGSSMSIFDTLEKLINIKKPTPYTFENFLKANDLETLVTIDKKRTVYEDEYFEIAIDELPEFGTFIEFEAKNGDQPFSQFLANIERATQGLFLEEVNTGYVEFYLQQQNESLYKKGKYLLYA